MGGQSNGVQLNTIANVILSVIPRERHGEKGIKLKQGGEAAEQKGPR